MAYNPYSAVNSIYNLKGQWDEADKSGDTQKKNNIAATAKKYYNELYNNGYGNVASELNNSNYSKARGILDSFSNISKNVNTTRQTVDNGANNPAYSQSMSVASSKNDELWQTIKDDHNYYKGEYENLSDYVNKNVSNTAEYKLAFKNIMPYYNYAALQGRDNQAASGAASNGGNIDSFSAANAARQQAALTAKGQELAHKIGLETYQSRVDNASKALSNLLAGNESAWSAMNNNINTDRAIANDYFNNGETAKNNDVARKSEIAEVTGVVPNEWVIKNNPYLNEDGTVKNENVDLSVVMENAKKAGNTELYNYAAQARFYKILNDYDKYGRYDDGNYSVNNTAKTESRRQFDEQIAASDRALNAEQSSAEADRQLQLDLADKSAQSSLDQINAQSNANIAQINAQAKANQSSNSSSSSTSNSSKSSSNKSSSSSGVDLLTGGDTTAPEKDYEAELNTVYDNSSKTVKAYIRNKLKPLITENSITETELKEHLIANSKDYDLEVKDMKGICEALGVDSRWVDNYKNSGFLFTNWGSGVEERK